jgi:SNF family Na+-dependent transporter
VVAALIPLAVSFYYVFIESWTVGYFLKYLTGGIGIDRAQPIAQQTATAVTFYTSFTGANQDGILFTGDSHFTLFCWVITFAVNIYFVYRGLSKGIEKFCSYAMPAMAICALIVLIRTLTLGTPDPNVPEQSVLNGLGYMWNPDFSKLGNFQTWLAAAGQIFFSISVGFGIIINYSSYMKPKDDVVLSGLTSTATNELFEVGFGGMITLTASVVFLGIAGTTAAVSTGSFGLGFTTLPVVFAHMGAIGNVMGAIWFFMLFLAAITSSLSMYQPAVAFLKEATGMAHGKATTLMVLLGTIGSALTIWFTQNGTFWNTLDFWVGTFLIFVTAAVEIILFSWVFGIERGWREAHYGSAIRIPPIFKFVMKWVAPLYLLVVFVGFAIQNLPGAIRQVLDSWPAKLAVGLIIVSIVFMAIAVQIGEKRWRASGMDLDDTQPADGDPAPSRN